MSLQLQETVAHLPPPLCSLFFLRPIPPSCLHSSHLPLFFNHFFLNLVCVCILCQTPKTPNNYNNKVLRAVNLKTASAEVD